MCVCWTHSWALSDGLSLIQAFLGLFAACASQSEENFGTRLLFGYVCANRPEVATVSKSRLMHIFHCSDQLRRRLSEPWLQSQAHPTKTHPLLPVNQRGVIRVTGSQMVFSTGTLPTKTEEVSIIHWYIMCGSTLLTNYRCNIHMWRWRLSWLLLL